eukprot:GHRR01001739.1.p1 GENE.GHRR01001739.1~~GHRR01001739.1.p1  ORF type:complete len:781 (+),score=205.53 GHRR01001739.1:562-2904(+)
MARASTFSAWEQSLSKSIAYKNVESANHKLVERAPRNWLATIIVSSLSLLVLGWRLRADNLQAQPMHVHSRAQPQPILVEHLIPGDCPLPGFCLRSLGQQESRNNGIMEPSDAELAEYWRVLTQYLTGTQFQARQTRLSSLTDERGILFVAGGNQMLAAVTATLWILRNKLNCTLPAEVAYVGLAKELHPDQIAVLNRTLGPVYGLDLSAVPYPAHHNRAGQEALLNPSHKFNKRYEAKPYALYHSRFKQVLLLDYDSVPLVNPSVLFDGPHMRLYGNLFWPDIPEASTLRTSVQKVFQQLGLNYSVLMRQLMDGQPMPGLAESGQLLVDRVRHADILEYLWWITSHSKSIYQVIYGDKDTFMLAFAAAGKATMYAQMPLPPGGVWNEAHRASAATMEPVAGQKGRKARKNTFYEYPQLFERGPRDASNSVYRFKGLVHYDHYGQPAFYHQTINKNRDWRSAPRPVGFQTGPMPLWVGKGLWHPRAAAFQVHHQQLVLLQINAPGTQQLLQPGGHPSSNTVQQGCPIATWSDYMHVQDLGIPLVHQPGLVTACSQHAVGTSSSSGSTVNSSNSTNGMIHSAVIRHLRESAPNQGALRMQASGWQTSQGQQWAQLLPFEEVRSTLLAQRQQKQTLATGVVASNLSGAVDSAGVAAQDNHALLRWLAEQQHQQQSPGKQQRTPAAAASTPALLVYPNWLLLQQNSTALGIERMYRIMPALRLQQQRLSNETCTDSNSHGLQQTIWSMLEMVQLCWFPDAVAWINSIPEMKQLVTKMQDKLKN